MTEASSRDTVYRRSEHDRQFLLDAMPLSALSRQSTRNQKENTEYNRLHRSAKGVIPHTRNAYNPHGVRIGNTLTRLIPSAELEYVNRVYNV